MCGRAQCKHKTKKARKYNNPENASTTFLLERKAIRTILKNITIFHTCPPTLKQFVFGETY